MTLIVVRPPGLGLLAFVGAYVLAQGIDAQSSYAAGILPTMLLTGVGFMLTFRPLNMAATKGVSDDEQGLASGLLFTSLQFGGAVAAAALDAGTAASGAPVGSAAAQPDGFHPALVVSVVVAVSGLLIAVSGLAPEARAGLARVRTA